MNFFCKIMKILIIDKEAKNIAEFFIKKIEAFAKI